MCSDESGIEIVVTDGSWGAFGEPTPRNLELFQQLQTMGGIAASVPPGTYIFNIEIIQGLDAYATLTEKKQ
jgi:hypothetical protein